MTLAQQKITYNSECLIYAHKLTFSKKLFMLLSAWTHLGLSNGKINELIEADWDAMNNLGPRTTERNMVFDPMTSPLLYANSKN